MSNQNRVISKITLGEYMSSSYLDYGFTDDMLYTHVKNLKKNYLTMFPMTILKMFMVLDINLRFDEINN